MLHKSVIIEIRQRLGISEEGFPNEGEALAWYRDQYRQAKGEDFSGTFGFQYEDFWRQINFKYDVGPDCFKIYTVYPLDDVVPLDREAMILAKEIDIPGWAAPWLRLVILVGEPPEAIEVRIPNHLMAPLGDLRVLVHPAEKLSLRKWRKTGEMMGLLPGEIDLWKVPGIMTTYSRKRKNDMELLYWQTLLAYGNAIGERRMRGQKGKRGLLKDTAKILKANYGWKYEEDSYTIRRFLDRAQKIWHSSSGQW